MSELDEAVKDAEEWASKFWREERGHAACRLELDQVGKHAMELQARIDVLREAVDAQIVKAEAAEGRATKATNALKQVVTHSLLEIRRAAFAPEIGVRYTEAIRSEIASECRRLEDHVRAVLADLAAEEAK